MSKLYFRYGVMGSSKTAEALMCRFNYIQKGFNVLLLKPSIDNRFEEDNPQVISRIGIKADCIKFDKNQDLIKLFNTEKSKYRIDVIIVDECQFCSAIQIEQLRRIAYDVNVLCYGLLTNFKTELFEGSKRLIEIADSLQEVKSVCKCGRKASVNARLVNGQITTSGDEVMIGAEECYESMCYLCFRKKLSQQKTTD